jgi:hypothetical protein
MASGAYGSGEVFERYNYFLLGFWPYFDFEMKVKVKTHN